MPSIASHHTQLLAVKLALPSTLPAVSFGNPARHLQAHVKLLEVVESVSLEEVNAIAASVLSYISHYRNEAALLEEVGPDPVSKGYAQPGPSRMTSIVACVPAFMDASGQSTGKTSPNGSKWFSHSLRVCGIC